VFEKLHLCGSLEMAPHAKKWPPVDGDHK